MCYVDYALEVREATTVSKRKRKRQPTCITYLSLSLSVLEMEVEGGDHTIMIFCRIDLKLTASTFKINIVKQFSKRICQTLCQPRSGNLHVTVSPEYATVTDLSVNGTQKNKRTQS